MKLFSELRYGKDALMTTSIYSVHSKSKATSKLLAVSIGFLLHHQAHNSRFWASGADSGIISYMQASTFVQADE